MTSSVPARYLYVTSTSHELEDEQVEGTLMRPTLLPHSEVDICDGKERIELCLVLSFRLTALEI